jgi:hypothetical protein
VIVRRFLVLVALCFWQGGFTFYASVVVPIGTSFFRSSLRQGFITRQVTWYLNLAAAVALVVLAWDVWAERDPAPWRRRARWGLWLLMALAQALLFALHPRLDELLQVRGMIVLDYEAFHPLHRTYLWTHTVQWGCVVLFLPLLLLAWRAVDLEQGRRDERGRTRGST